MLHFIGWRQDAAQVVAPTHITWQIRVAHQLSGHIGAPFLSVHPSSVYLVGATAATL